MYLVCLTCARLTCFERDTRLCREQVTFKSYLRDQRTKDWENERRPGKNTIQNIAKTTRKRKENMIYKTWSNWWETVPSHLAVFENPLSTSCILSAKSRVCDGLRWKPSAISGRFISIWPDKTNALYFSTVAFHNLVPRAFPLKNGWGPTHFLREKPWGRGCGVSVTDEPMSQ